MKALFSALFFVVFLGGCADVQFVRPQLVVPAPPALKPSLAVQILRKKDKDYFCDVRTGEDCRPAKDVIADSCSEGRSILVYSAGMYQGKINCQQPGLATGVAWGTGYPPPYVYPRYPAPCCWHR